MPRARCPDLDGNDKADCEESLVKNAGFDRNLGGWERAPDASAAWLADDAVENPRSGSLLVENATLGSSDLNGFVGVGQCLALPAGQYEVFAQVWIDPQPGPGSAGLIARVFDDDECLGEFLSSDGLLTIATSQWTPVGRSIEVPTEGRALQLQLGVLKPLLAEPFAAQFDNVLVRPE
jgi:hypothetical protein